MTSQIPFTPLTPESMGRLTLDEVLAFEAAACAVAGDQKPSLEVIATVVLTVQRLITEAVPGNGTGVAMGSGRPCSRCDGCGQLADTDDREPWTAWTSLPLRSSAAVLTGQVKPVPCDVCGGTGRRAATEEPRPGDQQLPVPNDGPSMHDLVIADLEIWTGPAADAVRALLAERKRIGLERYGSLLQAGNGRDCLRDLREELADAAVYARQGVEESAGGLPGFRASEAYEAVLIALEMAHGIGREEPDHG